MPAAITLVLDDAAAARVRTLWQALAEAGFSASMACLGYPPHGTLLTWPDAAGADVAAALSVLAQTAPPRLAPGAFDAACGEPAVLWLGVVATPPLLALHAACTAAVPAALDPHCAPGAWMLAAHRSARLEPGRGAGLRDAAFHALHRRIAAIEVVTHPPVAVVARRTLA